VGFELHPQLLADCHQVGRFALSHVLLHRNASLPWLILVPEVGADVRELYELDASNRRELDAEIDTLARYLKQSLGAQKTNVAAIGNLVPQLHIHVVGRHPGDPCWPGVVWGNLPPGPAWDPDKIRAIAAFIAAAAPTAASPA
jgi:diadenosine tetraphosphate (Ap4A) HIT family hydrolase